MDDNKSLQELEQEKSEVVKVEYELPKFYHKILAKFIDIILFVFITIVLFLASRKIVMSSGMYIHNDITYKTIEVESGLFVNSSTVPGRIYEFGDEIQPIVIALPKKEGLTYKAIVTRCHDAVEKFFTYLEPVNPQTVVEAKSEYDRLRLALKGTVEGHENLFVKRSEYDVEHLPYYALSENDNLIIPLNPEFADIPYYPFQNYFDRFYKAYIGDTLIDNYLVKNFPVLQDCMKKEGYYVFFIEFPTAYVAAAILVYFVPTLFFRRGRKTLGRALYRIGYVDPKCFSPSFWRNLLRFVILLFAELILSIFTFGLPLLISFTVMVFSKKKQNFPDYVLGLVEIDNSKQKIYYNKIDALSDKASIYKKAPDFKLPNL